MPEHKIIPTIHSPRITLRPLTLSDAKEIQRQAGSPKVAATTAAVPHPYLDGMAEAWISTHAETFEKGTGVTWGIETTAEKKLVGVISLMINVANLRAEIGYWVGEEFWNKGFCSEATKLAIKFAFENLKLNKVTARYMAENGASGKVMEKAGMVKEGYLAQDFFKAGRFIDMVVYGLLKENYR